MMSNKTRGRGKRNVEGGELLSIVTEVIENACADFSIITESLPVAKFYVIFMGLSF